MCQLRAIGLNVYKVACDLSSPVIVIAIAPKHFLFLLAVEFLQKVIELQKFLTKSLYATQH